MSPPEVRIGVIGFGTVGRSFIDVLTRRRNALEQSAHVRLTIAEIAVREPRSHDCTIAGARVHNDAESLANNPDIDLVVEVSGAAAADSWILSCARPRRCRRNGEQTRARDERPAARSARGASTRIVLRGLGRRRGPNRSRAA